MSAPNRLSHRLPGGLIDRKRTLSFRFDGREYHGHPGDTLASALLAGGRMLMGRSFKYHRPRGPLTAGSEEPNALVELGGGACREPNARATTTELFDGLEARSQNRWPSLSFDVLAVNDLLAPFLTAGFYYKTFMWPRSFWDKVYEPAIRRAAGLGRLSGAADPDVYDKGFLHCDLLVVGGGPAGLTAALAAARAGARVILAEEDFRFGGRLNCDAGLFLGADQQDWISACVEELSSLENVRLMPRTMVFGAFDHGIFGALENNPPQAASGPRQVLWRIYARRTVLAAGAVERPIAFADNDRPGIMLAGAVRAYANRWAVAVGRQVVVFTNNDDGYRTAADLMAKGVEVPAIVDTRSDAAVDVGVPVFAGAAVVGTSGRLRLSGVKLRLSSGEERSLKCDALALGGGWNPNLHLTCHQGHRPVWREDIAAFVPGKAGPPGLRAAGAACGAFSTANALEGGRDAANDALEDLGFRRQDVKLPEAEGRTPSIVAFWHVRSKGGRAWVDFQNDVTVKDVELAHRENFRSVEHLKRYTTLGMAPDQGKTANVIGLAVMAELSGRTIPETGTTTFRPPYAPVSVAAFAGRSTGEDFRPRRLTPSHDWAAEQGAHFVEAGLWLRAQWFPRPGESHWRQTVDREVLATRGSVGICDVSTLGKIDVQGTDAAAFLNRVYCNGFAKLPVGRVRYGLMLREDGMAMDDGTTARLAEDHFVTTTTTANAVAVFRHMEFCRQSLWPGLDVQLVSTTEAWAQFAVAGPNSRRVLQRVVDPEFDISNEAFPFMACGEITVCGGLRARLFRISFSGELAYEIAVPTRYGDGLIRRLMEAGRDFDITPYGTEALGVMRVEKGHAAGGELNGTVTARNLGMERMVSAKKDSIGAPLSRRESLSGEDVLKLVGFCPLDPAQPLVAGSHLLPEGAAAQASNDQGYLTSAVYSPTLATPIALGFLKRGDARLGEVVDVANPLMGTRVRARVVSPHFFDPEGGRLRV
ncbi:sarcosine oxidase subunit alpha family protein [Rhizobiales bacterium]|uniref:sarcosine oxidase subunit alpha family protein n=1 Tax=Hongsoonwoonella zoysiae TaxID=2821844 RepID=UPI00155FA5D0|nr:sarcosine oxidase subunit alpha family protein [Hongsoonwoonella zoysiae]NRG17761.1 sarcosine oxidase subunit alpha family protein [Hongsoonwoonella zoysiae]